MNSGLEENTAAEVRKFRHIDFRILSGCKELCIAHLQNRRSL